MNIQYASDLHLEFPENKAFLKANPLRPVGEILVLAGDIVPFAVLDQHEDFFDYLSDSFKTTYWIPGNHEYYHSNLEVRSGMFHEKIRENVHLLNNHMITLENVDLVFTSLWSKISPTYQWQIFNRLNDFRVIRHQTDFLSIELYNQLHDKCFKFLEKSFTSSKSDTIAVISHHAPTFMNYPEAYKGDSLNEAFGVELFDFIDRNQPDLWIFGHTHGNMHDFTIGKTTLVTNQMGYIRNNEHTLFRNDAYYTF